jgi:hypothetical protein
MLDYQRIVDDVRSSLLSRGGDGLDFLRAAAADYSVACDEANERLRQCGSLLRQGLRSEAIRLGDIEPNLLDVVALLDFPERAQWIDYSTRSGMAPPQPLLLDVATELNAAYAVEQPLASLLQQHRLLALSRGLLSKRIEVLRRLADLDPNNPVWLEDLQAFEQERHKQMQAETEQASRNGDDAAIALLATELSNEDLRNPAPVALVKAVREAQAAMRYRAVQGQLDRIANDLAAAKSNYRVDLGQSLRDRWNEVIASAGMQPTDKIAARAAPALQWLAAYEDAQRKREAKEAAEAVLWQAIGHECSLARLERLRAAVAVWGSLPTDLEERYRSWHATLQRSATVRRWFLIVGGAVCGIAAAVLIAVAVVHHQREQQIVAVVAALPELIEGGQLEKADALIGGLPQSAAADARVKEAKASLEEQWKKEKVRRAQFPQELKSATAWLEDVQKSLAATPDATILDRLRGELKRVEQSIERAHQLVRTEEERKGVAVAADLLTQVKEQWQRQTDDAFQKRYDDFDKLATELEKDQSDDPDKRQAKLEACRAEIRTWEAASSGVTSALLSRTTTIRERFSAVEKGMERQRQEASDVQQITATVGSIPEYLDAIKKYAEEHRQTDRASHLARAVEESLCWQTMDEWNKLTAPWRRQGIASLSASTAREQLATAQNLGKAFEDCPEGAAMAKWTPYLAAVAQREDAGQRIDLSLKRLFGDRLISRVWLIEIQKEENEAAFRYYCTEEPKQPSDPGQPFSFHYVASFDGKAKPGVAKPSSQFQVEIAPQTEVAKRVEPLLRGLNDGNWEAVFSQIIEAVVSGDKDREMDPILKVNLLQQTLAVAARGSHCLENAFAPHLQWSKETKIDPFVNWLDPTNPAAAQNRIEAKKALAGLPDLAGSVRSLKSEMESIRKVGIVQFPWVGWLCRRGDGTWRCAMKEPPSQAGDLCVVCRQTAGGKPLVKRIGRLDGGTANITATQDGLLLEGRPVYLAMP